MRNALHRGPENLRFLGYVPVSTSFVFEITSCANKSFIKALKNFGSMKPSLDDLWQLVGGL